MADVQMASGRANEETQRFLAAAAEDTDQELLERFNCHKDETAFALLVERHGPMVWSVCRRVLANEQDAEDAFQATFLVLVRRGNSLQNPQLLGSWLYGVANRTARKARAQAGRRCQQERQAEPVATESDPSNDLAWRELRSMLDEELNRLPEKYRLPLILCYLQGLTNEEAARRLGWPAGSMSYRLARGREMLRERMQARKREAPAGFFSLTLALGATAGSMSRHLADLTVQAAVQTAHGPAAALAVSDRVRVLVEATLQGMPVAHSRHWLRSMLPLSIAVFVALTLTLLASFAGEFSSALSSGPNAISGVGGTSPTSGASGGSCHGP
jgi:RNA polymerase sigma factor (sigma-70 family)